eukprot:TRINITY_DN13966_c0_g1_i2.p1 TRINITY_DN13966_c0_g1~~TRINITY_DN13966_c0_g1_i2.p1  ORF type:complete len:540 (-),score=98.19 TRINITY_DN13966_c0_g1_i2:31-1587(-)
MDPSKLVEDLALKVWLHPRMKVPFKFDADQHKFYVSPYMTIEDLMEQCEDNFFKASKKADANNPLELLINVLWNTKDHQKALNPKASVGKHFADGDSFGVFGDVQPAQTLEEKPEEAKLPVTVLTGFLGSGKTTLLNYILREQKEKKIAIIENEFGEISIDDALLKQDKKSIAERVVVMDNGCVCCSIRGDLEKGLLEIVQDMRNGAGIDAIMIESTGMADPLPIIRTFMASDRLCRDLRLDAVVTLADAKHLVGRLDDDVEEGKVNIAYQQIAFADRIILNKLDLVDTEQAIVCRDRIREINKFAKILPAVKSNVRLADITNLNAHNMLTFDNMDISKEAELAPELAHGDSGHGDIHSTGHTDHGDEHGHGHSDEHGQGHGGYSGESGHGHGHAQASHAGHNVGHGHDAMRQAIRHDGRVNSFAIVKEGELHPKRLSQWMRTIGAMSKDKGKIFRIKAILAVHEHPTKIVFHAVMDVSDEEEGAPWAEGEKKVSKIVFIGKSLDEKYLRDGFSELFV